MTTIRENIRKVIFFTLKTYAAKLLLLFIPAALVVQYFDRIWSWIKSISQLRIVIPQTEIPILTLILSTIGMVLSVFLMIKLISKRLKSSYYFIKRGDLAWKVKRNSMKVIPEPFCPRHRYRLLKEVKNRRVSFYCPANHTIEVFYENELEELYEIVKSIAESKMKG